MVKARRPANDASLESCPYVELQTEGDASTLPQQNTQSNVEDLVALDRLHEASVLWCLRERFFKGKPYTRTGDDIVVAESIYGCLSYIVQKREKILEANRLTPTL